MLHNIERMSLSLKKKPIDYLDCSVPAKHWIYFKN